MSSRYGDLSFNNQLDHFIKKANKKLEENVSEIIPGITHHALFVASTMSGKSYLLKQMLYFDYDGVFDRIVFISPTFDKENYSDLFEINEEDIYEEYDDSTLQEILDESKRRFMESNGDYFTLLILDDVADDFQKSRTFPSMISKCRHYGVTVFASVQYARMLSKKVRQQFVSFFIWPQISPENLKILAETLPSGYKKTSTYLQALRDTSKELNDKYAFMYVNKKLGDRIFYKLDHEMILDEE